MQRVGRAIAVILALSYALTACATAKTATVAPASPTPGPRPTPIPPPPPGHGLSSLIGQILANPHLYAGQTVVLVGYFRGQNLLDEVTTSMPTDRARDWLIKDKSGAIYVKYRGKLPFSPNSTEVWRIVRVRGEVMLRGDRLPYIYPYDVQWEGLVEDFDVLPALCKVAVHRFGGPEGLDHHIYWYENNTLVVHDAKTGWEGSVRLKKGFTVCEPCDLEKAFSKIRFFKLPQVVGRGCKGCVRYYIAAVDEKKQEPHFVTFYEGSLPPAVQEFVKLIVAKAGEAEGSP